MLTVGVLLLIVTVVAAVAWLLYSTRRGPLRIRAPQPKIPPPGRTGQLERLRSSRAYWGVEIRPGPCVASRALTGRRFPFAEAPSLPLDHCTASSCTCVFLGLPERRKWHRRAQPDRRQMIRYLQNHSERRSHRERRKVDVWQNITR